MNRNSLSTVLVPRTFTQFDLQGFFRQIQGQTVFSLIAQLKFSVPSELWQTIKETGSEKLLRSYVEV